MNQLYLDTARLLVQVAPPVFSDDTFALKGGTAINLFIRDMPRLSVDLDLVFPDYSQPRDEALARINEAIRGATERLRARGFQTHTLAAPDVGETKLLVRLRGIEVKVEVNFVILGTVNPVRSAALSPAARESLLADLTSSGIAGRRVRRKTRRRNGQAASTRPVRRDAAACA